MAVNRALRYRLQIETVTPLHIGSGQILRRDFEYAVQGGQTWVIEPDAVAEHLYAAGPQQAEWQRLLKGAPPGTLLSAEDFRSGSELFRYTLKGEPRSQERHAPVREQIKTPWSMPYIPGSSLKGALRTAVLAEAFRQTNMQYDPARLGDRPKLAARSLEHDLASPEAPRNQDPYYDMFRAVQVNDSEPDGDRRLMLAAAAVYAGRDDLIPIALECIPRGVVFAARLVLDRPLLEGVGRDRLGWGEESQIRWLKQLRQRSTKFSLRRCQEEHKYWKERGTGLESFYLSLFAQLQDLDRDPKARVTFLQLGWGAGWTSKTFGSALTKDAQRFHRLVQQFPKALDPQKSYKLGDPFPKSRKVVLDLQGKPIAPLGWVKITWEREE